MEHKILSDGTWGKGEGKYPGVITCEKEFHAVIGATSDWGGLESWGVDWADDSAGLAMLSVDERLGQSMLSNESPSLAMYPCDFDRFRILGNRKNILPLPPLPPFSFAHASIAGGEMSNWNGCIRLPSIVLMAKVIAALIDAGGSDAEEMFVHGFGATCTTSLQLELLVGGVLLRGLWNGDVNTDDEFLQGVGPLPVLISRRAQLLRSASIRSSGTANNTDIRSW